MMNFLSQDKRSRRQADNEGDENERGGGEICKEVSSKELHLQCHTNSHFLIHICRWESNRILAGTETSFSLPTQTKQDCTSLSSKDS